MRKEVLFTYLVLVVRRGDKEREEYNKKYIYIYLNPNSTNAGTLIMSFGGVTKTRVEGRIGYPLLVILVLMCV